MQTRPIRQNSARTADAAIAVQPAESRKTTALVSDGGAVSSRTALHPKETYTYSGGKDKTVRVLAAEAPGDTAYVSKKLGGYDDSVKPVYRIRIKIFTGYYENDVEGARRYRTEKNYMVDGDTVPKVFFRYDDDGKRIYRNLSAQEIQEKKGYYIADTTKNALFIDPFGVGLQYERRLDEKWSLLGRYAGIFRNDYVNYQSFETHVRYYQTGKALNIILIVDT